MTNVETTRVLAYDHDLRTGCEPHGRPPHWQTRINLDGGARGQLDTVLARGVRPTGERNWRLESRQHRQTGKSALRGSRNASRTGVLEQCQHLSLIHILRAHET